MKDVRVAAVCMNSAPAQIDRNLKSIGSFVLRAADEGAKIICFPELSITGYALENPERICAPPLFKEASERLLEMARLNRLTILAGLIESSEENEKPYITQIVANPDGTLWRYRKTHLSPPEMESYKAGEEIQVYRSPYLCFGIQLCYESHFPEMSTLMALEGAEAIFMPHASPRGNPLEKRSSWLRHLPSRAFDNGVYVIACNQAREEKGVTSFPGVVLALGPSGRILEEYAGAEETLLFVDLKINDLEEVRNHRMKYFLPNRRPELYKRISGLRD